MLKFQPFCCGAKYFCAAHKKVLKRDNFTFILHLLLHRSIA